MRADLFYKSQYGGRFKTMVDEGLRLAKEFGHDIEPLEKWENDKQYMGTYHGFCTKCRKAVRVSMEEGELTKDFGFATHDECQGKPWL